MILREVTGLFPCLIFCCGGKTTRVAFFRANRSILAPSMKRSYSQAYKEPESKPKRSKLEMATTSIHLTSQEARLRKLLLDVAHYIDELKEIEEPIVLRWAGGWVRDKLLDVQSHDIDTAINSMTGYAFILKLQEYLTDTKNLEKHALQQADVGNVYKIAANPEKSKHLETATTRLLGFDVDFVNLRKETYAEDSRNPQMEFGTATEDALRRDATINALFYNLHSDLIEDFTDGLKDMKSKTIRTPLEPHTTFMDDPLRVLRLIRFASRLDFSIDSESEKSMSDPAVMEALRLKISRERVGTELEKMLRGNNPRSSLQIIDRLGLYSTIFTNPTAKEFPVPDIKNWSAVYECLDLLKSMKTPGSIYDALVRAQNSQYHSWILACLTPWVLIPEPIALVGSKIPLPHGTLVAKEGIKAESRLCSLITGAFRNYSKITALKDLIQKDDASIHERDTLGMSIREWDSKGGNWKLQALFAILAERIQMENLSDYDSLFQGWQNFLEHLEKMDIMDAPSIKPLIDGKILCAALGGVKPGVWMKPALDACMAWQLRNPKAKDPKEAFEEVKSRREELQIPQV